MKAFGVGRKGTGWSRRRWLSHCSAAALGFAAVGSAAAQSAGASATGSAAAAGERRIVLVVGDSLSAEYGIRRGSGWVALLQQRLDRERPGWRVVNASVSGDTTSGGRSRLPALLREHRPAVVVIELGGNDALRGLPMSMTRANLTEMTRAAKAAGARVLIAGMQVPPNYGRRYAEEFAAVFPEVAKAEGVALLPFFLAGVADVPEAESLFQSDRIHPKEEAHPIILGNVWPVLRPLLR
ncbi:MAG: arylesterase [Ideonella sp.]|nr:arylesterase [Ideonella sp.]